ncbi:MAG: hypothetical protein MJY56_07530 [Bacteroidales bacterium]|nr:hypothetical protein [Bacteroidales bacterium]
MLKRLLTAAVPISILLLCSCSGKTALETYWADDYDGPLGIQVEDNARGVATMYLAGKPFYAAGINDFALFVRTLSNEPRKYVPGPNLDAGAFLEENLKEIEEDINILKEQKVPVVRFCAVPFFHYEMHYYLESREEYLAVMDRIATACDEAHILLVPCLLWQYHHYNEYFGEPLTAWNDPDSKTYEFLGNYTTDMVNTLKGHKSIAMWECSNELILACDLDRVDPERQPFPIQDYAASHVRFAETCNALDPNHRMVGSGSSVREQQYNISFKGVMEYDSVNEFKEVMRLSAPYPMQGYTEHLYALNRPYAEGDFTLDESVKCVMECCAESGRVYYVGEYANVCDEEWDQNINLETAEAQFECFYDNKVQLTLLWNYGLHSEHGFGPNTEYGQKAFQFLRDANKRLEKYSK